MWYIYMPSKLRKLLLNCVVEYHHLTFVIEFIIFYTFIYLLIYLFMICLNLVIHLIILFIH